MLGDMDTKRKRKPSAHRHPIRVERVLHRLRRHAIPSALVVGGVGLAVAGVPVGIGWGLVLAGVALAFQPYSGSTSDSSDQAGSASARSHTGHSSRRPQRQPQEGATTPTHRRSPTGRRSRERGGRAHRPGAARGPAGATEASPRSDRARTGDVMALSIFVWVMIGMALWHFSVLVPDRFWGGIIGAFGAAVAGALALRLSAA